MTELTAEEKIMRANFAAAALTGILAIPGTAGGSEDIARELAQVCFGIADEMVKASKEG